MKLFRFETQVILSGSDLGDSIWLFLASNILGIKLNCKLIFKYHFFDSNQRWQFLGSLLVGHILFMDRGFEKSDWINLCNIVDFLLSFVVVRVFLMRFQAMIWELKMHHRRKVSDM